MLAQYSIGLAFWSQLCPFAVTWYLDVGGDVKLSLDQIPSKSNILFPIVFLRNDLLCEAVLLPRLFMGSLVLWRQRILFLSSQFQQ